jgi:hypothetical protein
VLHFARSTLAAAALAGSLFWLHSRLGNDIETKDVSVLISFGVSWEEHGSREEPTQMD